MMGRTAPTITGALGSPPLHKLHHTELPPDAFRNAVAPPPASEDSLGERWRGASAALVTSTAETGQHWMGAAA
jgi:hypothetical protein